MSPDDNPPWRKPGEKIIGEVTTDCGVHRRVTPRIFSELPLPEHLIEPTRCENCGYRLGLQDPRTLCWYCKWILTGDTRSQP